MRLIETHYLERK